MTPLPEMTDDRTADDTQAQEQEAESPPELADWWVWGVRKAAAVIADLKLTQSRPIGSLWLNAR